MTAGDGSTKRALSRFVSGGTGQASEDISFSVRTGGSWYELNVDQSFVDPSAWYHFVWVWDSDNGTAADRMRIYLNGDRLTSFSNTPSYPASATATDSWNNSSYAHQIGFENNTRFFDGYLAEMYHIDGQALTPASFGETNSSTGQWIPKDASGLTFGTRGFYLKGEDSSDLGNDSSGNGNDFSSSGLAAADQVTDSPTNNLPTLNPLSSGTGALSDGNLQYTGVSGNWSNSRLNLLVPDTGKWAIRMKSASSYQQIIVGLCAPDGACPYTDIDVNGVAQIRYNTLDGNFVTRVGGSLVNDTGPPTVAAQTFFQLLFDMDNGKLGMAADGASSGTFADTSTYSIMDLNGASLSTARQPFVQAYAGTDSNAGVIIDAGQSGWETTVTGFKNLSLANLDDPAIANPGDHFQTILYTGNGTTGQSITGVGFQPDFTWTRIRSPNGYSHQLFDAVRGAGANLQANNTNAEGDISDEFKSFDSDGFTIDDVNQNVNENNSLYVAWNWKANGSGSSNGDGDITATVSANTTAGFSIVTYSGSGNSGDTVGHGLGVKPSAVLVKVRSTTDHWILSNWEGDYAEKIKLNDTEAASSSSGFVTAANTSTFTLGNDVAVNGSGRTYVAYCWNEVEGYSKFGTFEGNGSTDGPFVYTGFKPRFILFIRTDATEGRNLIDTARGSGNFGSAAGTNGRNPTAGNELNAKINVNDANTEEDNPAGSRKVSYLSNGFKVRNTNTAMNASGGDYIYMAFAESPFKTATAR